MASTILKGAPDRDCYAVYENVVGTFSAVGDRATVTLRRRDLVDFCAKLTVDADGAVLDR